MTMPSDPAAYFARQMFILSVTGAPQEGGFAEEVPALFAELASDVYVAAGGEICRKGETADRLFFLVSGDVLLEGSTIRPHPGEVFGGRDAIMHGTFSTTARAESDVHILSVPIDAWLEFLEDHFDATCIVMGNMARRNLGRHASHRSGSGQECKAGESVLSIADRMLLLRRIAPFESASVQALATLAQSCDTRELAKGEVLECNDGREYLHVLVDGEVDLITSRGAERVKATSCVNLAEAFAGELKDCKIEAKTPAFLITLALEDVLDVMEEHFELAKATMITLTAE